METVSDDGCLIQSQDVGYFSINFLFLLNTSTLVLNLFKKINLLHYANSYYLAKINGYRNRSSRTVIRLICGDDYIFFLTRIVICLISVERVLCGKFRTPCFKFHALAFTLVPVIYRTNLNLKSQTSDKSSSFLKYKKCPCTWHNQNVCMIYSKR